MKRLPFTLLLSFTFFLGFSQTDLKKDHIKQLLEITGAGNLGVQMAENMIASFKQTIPDIPAGYWEGFRKELKSDTLINMIIPVYDKYYTDEELVGMIRFYETPLGKKIIATMPMIMQESMQVGQEWGKKLGEKLYLNLKEKGYLKEG